MFFFAKLKPKYFKPRNKSFNIFNYRGFIGLLLCRTSKLTKLIKKLMLTMSIVHSTLRDATAPSTERCIPLEKRKRQRTFYTFGFANTKANAEKLKELKYPQAHRTRMIRTVFILKNEIVRIKILSWLDKFRRK